MNSMRKAIFADRLRGMQGQAEQAMADYQPGGITIPAGNYNARVTCELAETKAGKLKIQRSFSIVEGEFTGLTAWDGLVIEDNDVGLQIARRWLETHGEEWPEGDMAELENIVNRIHAAAPYVAIKLKNVPSKDGERTFTNVSVLRVLDPGDVAPAAAAAPAAAPAPKAAAKPAAAPKAATAAAPKAAAPKAAPAPAPAPAAEPAGDPLDGMNRAVLKKFIADNDLQVRVTIKMTDADIRAAIRALAAETPAEAGEQEIDAARLLAFCGSQGIGEAQDGMSGDEILEIMSGYQFNYSELTPEEIDMMGKVGLAGQIINQPKPAAAARPAGVKVK